MTGVHHYPWFMGCWGYNRGKHSAHRATSPTAAHSYTPMSVGAGDSAPLHLMGVGAGDSAPLTCCWGWAHWLRVRSCFERCGDWPAPGVGDSCKERCLPAGATRMGPFPMRGGGLTWANGVTMRSSACLKVRTGADEEPGLQGGHCGVRTRKEETGQGNRRNIP